MQIALTLKVPAEADYVGDDLGFLLHKNPNRIHERAMPNGTARLFFTRRDETATTAVLHLELDPVGLVQDRNAKNIGGSITHFINDRPYAANSFLSVALSRMLAQSMNGSCKERQELADKPLPFSVRVEPVLVTGDLTLPNELFSPLGYEVTSTVIESFNRRHLTALTLDKTAKLSEVLNHLYVLIPILDDAKHYWIEVAEIRKLLDKGKDWLPEHPLKDLILQRGLRHIGHLYKSALAQLDQQVESEPDDADAVSPDATEAAREAPIRLHEQRMERIVDILRDDKATSIVDLGCGEGKLLTRLLQVQGFNALIGVDPSITALERAGKRLQMDEAGDKKQERITLQPGSLTYADRRLRGKDAAVLSEVIEHLEPHRLADMERALFGDMRPGTIIITTPNFEYNALFPDLAPSSFRHDDHRFEWTRKEFEDWGRKVAADYGYNVTFEGIGLDDDAVGPPSQLAHFQSIVGKGKGGARHG